MATIDVKSEMGGIVWKIEVQPGGSVAEEDPILVLESMKMEIPVLAPQSGTVAEILVGQGDTVREGQIVARMTT